MKKIDNGRYQSLSGLAVTCLDTTSVCMGGGKGKKYHSKENKHNSVISVNKQKKPKNYNKRHYLLNNQ
jgi:hypothetical protein